MVIGISGKKGSGKDTFAGYITEAIRDIYNTSNLDIEIHHRSFAAPLKKMVSTLTGIELAVHSGSIFTNNVYDFTRAQKEQKLVMFGGMTLGRFLQVFGTDIMRNYDTDIWVKSMESFLEDMDDDIVIVPDVRMANEATCIHDQCHGILVAITRENNEVTLNDGRDDTHQSETEVDDIIANHVIKNDASLEELRKQAFDLVHNHLHQLMPISYKMSMPF